MESTHKDVDDQARIILGVLGGYLILFGVIATGWSACAAFAQSRYAAIILKPHDTRTELRLAGQSFRFYSRNYSLCIRAAATASKAAGLAQDAEVASRLYSDAEYWVTRGLDLNPWVIELNYLKARLLARRDSPDEAVKVWQDYSNWNFWNPRNLEILAKFQEEAEQYDEAMQTLEWLKPWPQYNATRERIRMELDETPAKTETQPGSPITPAEPAAGRL